MKRRNMKERNETREEEEERRGAKKKSQILYFDIFYVDLDSTGTAELNRGFSPSFCRAISHECVSCFTLPTDSSRMIFSRNMNT